jgi:hypothetical protein
VNAVVWISAGTYLVLDASADRIPAPTPILDTGVPSSFGRAFRHLEQNFAATL